MQENPGQPLPSDQNSQSPASDLHGLLAEIKELKAGLLGDSTTHDNPTFEGPPWQDQQGLRLDIPMGGLDETLEDMVARDARLQYILSPQAEEHVVRSSYDFSKSPRRVPPPGSEPSRDAAGSAQPPVPAASAAAPATPAGPAAGAASAAEHHFYGAAPSTAAVPHTPPPTVASAAAVGGKVPAVTPAQQPGTARRLGLGSRIGRPSATPAGHLQAAAAPATAAHASTPVPPLRNLAQLRTQPTHGAASSQTPSTNSTPRAGTAATTQQTPRTARQKIAGAVGALGSMMAGGRGTPRATGGSGGPFAPSGSSVARPTAPGGNGSLSSAAPTPPASLRKRPPAAAPESHSAAPARKAATGSVAPSGSTPWRQSRTTAAATPGAAGKAPGRTAQPSTHQGASATSGAGTFMRGTRAGHEAAAAAPTLAPAPAPTAASPTAADNELAVQVSQPSLTLPSLGGADLLAAESLEALVANDPALHSWLSATKLAMGAAASTSGGGSPSLPLERTSRELLRPLEALMADAFGAGSLLDGDADTEMDLLLLGGNSVNALDGAAVAAGPSVQASSPTPAGSTVMSTPVAKVAAPSVTPVALEFPVVPPAVTPVLAQLNGWQHGLTPGQRTPPWGLPGPGPGLVTPVADATPAPQTTTNKVRELLGLDEEVSESGLFGPPLTSEELWRNIAAEANSVFKQHIGTDSPGDQAAATPGSSAAASPAFPAWSPAPQAAYVAHGTTTSRQLASSLALAEDGSGAHAPAADASAIGATVIDEGPGELSLAPTLAAALSRGMPTPQGLDLHALALSTFSSAAATSGMPGTALQTAEDEALHGVEEDDEDTLLLLAAEAAAAAEAVVAGGSSSAAAAPANETAATAAAGDGRQLMHQDSSASSIGFDAAIAFEAELTSRRLVGGSSFGGAGTARGHSSMALGSFRASTGGAYEAVQEEDEELTSPVGPSAPGPAAASGLVADGAFDLSQRFAAAVDGHGGEAVSAAGPEAATSAAPEEVVAASQPEAAAAELTPATAAVPASGGDLSDAYAQVSERTGVNDTGDAAEQGEEVLAYAAAPDAMETDVGPASPAAQPEAEECGFGALAAPHNPDSAPASPASPAREPSHGEEANGSATVESASEVAPLAALDAFEVDAVAGQVEVAPSSEDLAVAAAEGTESAMDAAEEPAAVAKPMKDTEMGGPMEEERAVGGAALPPTPAGAEPATEPEAAMACDELDQVDGPVPVATALALATGGPAASAEAAAMDVEAAPELATIAANTQPAAAKPAEATVAEADAYISSGADDDLRAGSPVAVSMAISNPEQSGVAPVPTVDAAAAITAEVPATNAKHQPAVEALTVAAVKPELAALAEAAVTRSDAASAAEAGHAAALMEAEPATPAVVAAEVVAIATDSHAEVREVAEAGPTAGPNAAAAMEAEQPAEVDMDREQALAAAGPAEESVSPESQAPAAASEAAAVDSEGTLPESQAPAAASEAAAVEAEGPVEMPEAETQMVGADVPCGLSMGQTSAPEAVAPTAEVAASANEAEPLQALAAEAEALQAEVPAAEMPEAEGREVQADARVAAGTKDTAAALSVPPCMEAGHAPMSAAAVDATAAAVDATAAEAEPQIVEAAAQEAAQETTAISVASMEAEPHGVEGPASPPAASVAEAAEVPGHEGVPEVNTDEAAAGEGPVGMGFEVAAEPTRAADDAGGIGTAVRQVAPAAHDTEAESAVAEAEAAAPAEVEAEISEEAAVVSSPCPSEAGAAEGVRAQERLHAAETEAAVPAVMEQQAGHTAAEAAADGAMDCELPSVTPHAPHTAAEESAADSTAPSALPNAAAEVAAYSPVKHAAPSGNTEFIAMAAAEVSTAVTLEATFPASSSISTPAADEAQAQPTDAAPCPQTAAPAAHPHAAPGPGVGPASSTDVTMSDSTHHADAPSDAPISSAQEARMAQASEQDSSEGAADAMKGTGSTTHYAATENEQADPDLEVKLTAQAGPQSVDRMCDSPTVVASAGADEQPSSNTLTADTDADMGNALVFAAGEPCAPDALAAAREDAPEHTDAAVVAGEASGRVHVVQARELPHKASAGASAALIAAAAYMGTPAGLSSAPASASSGVASTAAVPPAERASAPHEQQSPGAAGAIEGMARKRARLTPAGPIAEGVEGELTSGSTIMDDEPRGPNDASAAGAAAVLAAQAAFSSASQDIVGTIELADRARLASDASMSSCMSAFAAPGAMTAATLAANGLTDIRAASGEAPSASELLPSDLFSVVIDESGSHILLSAGTPRSAVPAAPPQSSGPPDAEGSSAPAEQPAAAAMPEAVAPSEAPAVVALPAPMEVLMPKQAAMPTGVEEPAEAPVPDSEEAPVQTGAPIVPAVPAEAPTEAAQPAQSEASLAAQEPTQSPEVAEAQALTASPTPPEAPAQPMAEVATPPEVLVPAAIPAQAAEEAPAVLGPCVAWESEMAGAPTDAAQPTAMGAPTKAEGTLDRPTRTEAPAPADAAAPSESHAPMEATALPRPTSPADQAVDATNADRAMAAAPGGKEASASTPAPPQSEATPVASNPPPAPLSPARASTLSAGHQPTDANEQQPLLQAWQVLAPPAGGSSSSQGASGDADGAAQSRLLLGRRTSTRSMLSASSRLSRMSSRQVEDDENTGEPQSSQPQLPQVLLPSQEPEEASGLGSPWTTTAAAEASVSGGDAANGELFAEMPEQYSIIAEPAGASSDAMASTSDALATVSVGGISIAPALVGRAIDAETHALQPAAHPTPRPLADQLPAAAAAGAASPAAAQPAAGSARSSTSGAASAEVSELVPAWKVAAQARTSGTGDADAAALPAPHMPLGRRRSLLIPASASQGSSRLQHSSSRNALDDMDVDGMGEQARASPSSAPGRVTFSPTISESAAAAIADAEIPESSRYDSDDEGTLLPAWKARGASPPLSDSPDAVAAARSVPLGSQPSSRSGRRGSSRLHRASAADADDFSFADADLSARSSGAQPGSPQAAGSPPARDGLCRSRSRTQPGIDPSLGSPIRPAPGSANSAGSPVAMNSGALSDSGTPGRGTLAARTSSRRMNPDALGTVPLPRRSFNSMGDPNVDALRPAWQVLPLAMSGGSSSNTPSLFGFDSAGGAAGGGSVTGTPAAAAMLSSMRSSSRLSRMSSGIPDELLAELRLQAQAAVGHLQGHHEADDGNRLADILSSVEESPPEPAAPAAPVAGDGAGGTVHAWKMLPTRAPVASSGGAGPDHAAPSVPAGMPMGISRLMSFGARPTLASTRAGNQSSRFAVAASKAPALQVSFDTEPTVHSLEPAVSEDGSDAVQTPRPSPAPPPPTARADEQDAAVVHAWKLVSPVAAAPSTAGRPLSPVESGDASVISVPRQPQPPVPGRRPSLRISRSGSMQGSRLSRSSTAAEDYADESYAAGASGYQSLPADSIGPADSADQAAVAEAANAAAVAAAYQDPAFGDDEPDASPYRERTSAPVATLADVPEGMEYSRRGSRTVSEYGSASSGSRQLMRNNTTGSLGGVTALVAEGNAPGEATMARMLASRQSLRVRSSSGSRLSRVSSARDPAPADSDPAHEDGTEGPSAARSLPLPLHDLSSGGGGRGPFASPPPRLSGGGAGGWSPLQVKVRMQAAAEAGQLSMGGGVSQSVSAIDGGGGTPPAPGADTPGSKVSTPGSARRSVRSNSSRLSRMNSMVSESGLAGIEEEGAEGAVTAPIRLEDGASGYSSDQGHPAFRRSSSGRLPPPARSANAARMLGSLAPGGPGSHGSSPLAASPKAAGATAAGGEAEEAPLLPAWKVLAPPATRSRSADGTDPNSSAAVTAVDGGERVSSQGPLGSMRQPLLRQRSSSLNGSRLRRVTSGIDDGGAAAAVPLSSSAAPAASVADADASTLASVAPVDDGASTSVAAPAAPAAPTSAEPAAPPSVDSGAGGSSASAAQPVAPPAFPGGESATTTQEHSCITLANMPSARFDRGSSATASAAPVSRTGNDGFSSFPTPAGLAATASPPTPSGAPALLAAGEAIKEAIKEEEALPSPATPGTPASHASQRHAAAAAEAVAAAAPSPLGTDGAVAGAEVKAEEQQQEQPEEKRTAGRSRGLFACFSCVRRPSVVE